MTWIFVEICSSTYQRNMDVELTWIQRSVPVGHVLYDLKFIEKKLNTLYKGKKV